LTTSLELASGETDDGSPLPSNKVITMKELNQMKLPPYTTSYVLVTDAEVREAVGESDGRKKSTWQEIEIQRRLEIDKLKERRNHEHGIVGELHSK